MKLSNFFLVLVLMLGVSGFILFFNNSNNVTANAVSSLSNEIQVVKLHVEGSQYIMEPSVLKVGVPVRLVADLSNMPGCSKSIVISSFNVRGTFSDSSSSVEFTPNKAGTYYITCSMNMYRGTFEVVNADGTKSNYVQSAPSGGMTCGRSGGGCGCGGSR